MVNVMNILGELKTVTICFFISLLLSGCSSKPSGKYLNEKDNTTIEFFGESIVALHHQIEGSYTGTYKKVKGGYEISIMGGLMVLHAEMKGKDLIVMGDKYVKQKK